MLFLSITNNGLIMKARNFILVSFLFLISSSCSLNTLVIRQMTPILQNSALAIYEENDLDLAEKALAADLKLIDGLLKSDPENEELLLLAAQGYAGYALGFLEDEQPQRAKNLYLRARDYTLKVLRKDKDFALAEKASLDQLAIVLQKYDRHKTAALFWAGFAWSGYINLSLDNVDALADLPQVQLFMQRVEELDPGFFYGSVYLFWGSLYGMKPRIMGGDPQKAAEYFRKNFELNDNKFLLAHVYAARFYAAKTLDEALFDRYIKHVLETPCNVIPEARLLNQIARGKARRLQKLKEELF